MHANTVIKRLHCLLTAILLIVVCSFLAYQHFFNAPPHDSFVSKQKLSDTVTLYITKYDEGGATVSEVYRYYLDKDNSGNVMKALKDRSPFLEANTGSVTASAYGNTVNVRITGKVYSFTNSDLFYANGITILPVINLIANGTRD
ncbi:hypothetical protein [Pseudenterobacter timonensis]|uniref:Uncharacterized protein n=1 Tax=Pseudenterobacter timonensis TaxID=1755099 RepID=A0ABV4A3C6_9ENTR